MKKIEKTKRILMISVALLLSAIVYNLFLLPLSLVPGGTNGLATIAHYAYQMNPALVILIISVACMIISWMYLGFERTKGTIIACLIYPLLVELTSQVRDWIQVDTSDILLIILFAGVLGGIANGLMYKSGYSNGGLPIISQVLHKKFKTSIARTSLIMNIIIVIIGAYFFGITKALYSVIYLYINSIVIDRVLLGISNNKAFYIITDKENEIKDFIIENLKHTVTTFNVKGGYLEDKKKVILTVIPSREYYHLTEGIKKIDENAFFVAMDAYEVEGAK